MSAHTPGLLRVDPNYKHDIQTADGRFEVACADPHILCGGQTDAERQAANTARLVACWNACEGLADPSAAQELLEAATVAREALSALIASGDPVVFADALAKLDAAIAKARGQS